MKLLAALVLLLATNASATYVHVGTPSGNSSGWDVPVHIGYLSVPEVSSVTAKFRLKGLVPTSVTPGTYWSSSTCSFVMDRDTMVVTASRTGSCAPTPASGVLVVLHFTGNGSVKMPEFTNSMRDCNGTPVSCSWQYLAPTLISDVKPHVGFLPAEVPVQRGDTFEVSYNVLTFPYGWEWDTWQAHWEWDSTQVSMVNARVTNLAPHYGGTFTAMSKPRDCHQLSGINYGYGCNESQWDSGVIGGQFTGPGQLFVATFKVKEGASAGTTYIRATNYVGQSGYAAHRHTGFFCGGIAVPQTILYPDLIELAHTAVTIFGTTSVPMTPFGREVTFDVAGRVVNKPTAPGIYLVRRTSGRVERVVVR